MENNSTASNFGKLVGMICAPFVWGLFLYVAYNWVAYNYNMPQMGYWVALCVVQVWGLIWRPLSYLSNKNA